MRYGDSASQKSSLALQAADRGYSNLPDIPIDSADFLNS